MGPLKLTTMSPSKSNFSWDINQENVLETLGRAGGCLESRLVMGHFMAGIKDDKFANNKSLNDLSSILRNVAVLYEGKDKRTMWRLKKGFL